MDKASCNPEIWGGIECTINRVGNVFFDQLNYSGHYTRDADLDLIGSLGISQLRFPILWEKHEPFKDQPIDWSWSSGRLERLREKGIRVIAGLVHHGSGPAFTNLLDPQFPALLASYARKVAEQFPWIQDYTPVNEPLTTARFSGLYGLWYPHHRKDQSFLRCLIHELKGTVLAMREIREINPNARLVQTEDLAKTYSTPKLKYQANFENLRRWLTFDILSGKLNRDHKLWKYFTRKGIPEADLDFFLENPCPPDICGFNHYLTSERYLDDRTHLYPSHTVGGNGRHRYSDVEAVRVDVGEETGLPALLKEAWERYQLPIAITEVHLHCHREEQLRWFRQVWETCVELKKQGMDIRAVTSWALLGSFGWNKLLTEEGGLYEPGAFDVRNGEPRPTALARFIQSIQTNPDQQHHLSEGKGWWQRSTRLIYEPRVTCFPVSTGLKPLLIIGKNGTLGKAFAKVCEDRMLPYRILSRQDCDISNPDSIAHTLHRYQPWAVINAAGYVRVDDAEHEQDACFRDNAIAAHMLAKACEERNIRCLNFSSDLVFDGGQRRPYTETDVPNPINIYGKSKAEAEYLIGRDAPSSLVVRTSAFFGPWDEYNFVEHIRRHLAGYQRVSVANDITVSPTYVPHLAHAALDLLIDEEKGIWHLVNNGAITWSDWAYQVADLFRLDHSLIHSVPSHELDYRAKRPLYTVLGSSRGMILPEFTKAMNEFSEQAKAAERRVA